MFTYFILVLFLLFHFISSFPRCISEVGDDVDWYYIYKLPRDKGHPDPRVQNGVAYMYMTSKTYKFGWLLSAYGIDERESMLAQTLDPMYRNASTMYSMIYNDQPPIEIEEENDEFTNIITKNNKTHRKKPEFLGGHTKGVVFGDKLTSVWLVHSVPKFPEIPDAEIFLNESYVYPVTGTKFGQSFLCVSVDTKTMNQLGLQLHYNEPLLVYAYIPVELKPVVPTLVMLAQNKTIKSAPWYRIANFETLEGRKFVSFAKSGKFNHDLYAELVSDQLKSDLLTETWINGPGVLDSECYKQYKVYNVEAIKFPLLNISFTSHFDHSKWTIAESPQNNRIEMPRRYVSFLKVFLKDLKQRKLENSSSEDDDHWICVGDINRAATQERRGGGTVCTSDPFLWRTYKTIVKSVQPCK